MKTFLSLVFALFFYAGLNAQNDCACCTEQHQQFDFWLGEWTVVNSSGQKVGENSISRIEDNCILVEKWKGAQGTTGTSHNYFDKKDGSWNQLWVDNKGNVLKLKGGLDSGKMVLRSDLVKDQDGNPYYNQISWTENSDGTVSQLWELYDAKGGLIRQLFLGIYRKMP